MTTDREILEMAAKAAGFEVYEFQPDVPKGLWVKYEGKSFVWMPYIDDGDALRLAVKLNITVYPGCAYTPTGKLINCRARANRLAATRRAIVRAAAEIGRNMR